MTYILHTLSRLPFVQKYWRVIRERKILEQHRRVAHFWHPLVVAYLNNEIERFSFAPKKRLPENKIIWQYWGQGLDINKLPEIVQICFHSVEKHKGQYQIIRLSDDTINEYLDFPESIGKKRETPEFNRTFFSDLLRLALLKTYGGVWLDATVLLTGTLPNNFAELDYFVYQRDWNEVHKRYWENSYAYYWGWRPGFRVRMLNSIIFAKKDSLVVSALLDLILHYWKTQEGIVDYFFFQILYSELMENQLAGHKCPVVSDTIPHLLQAKINGGCNFVTYRDIFAQSGIHKLTYKNVDADKLKQVLSQYVN
jgi:hypothetical protein